MARWRQKPAIGVADLDWAHPSAHKLLIYLPFLDQVKVAPRNMATPTMVSTLGASVACSFEQTARYGGGIHPIGGASISVSNPANVNAAAGDFMIRLLMRPNSWPGAFTEFISKATGAVGRELCLFADTSGNLSFYGVGGSTGVISPVTGLTAGKDWDFVWARSAGLNTFYVNGVPKGSVTNASALPEGTQIPFQFGANISGGGTDADITYAGIQFWQRAPYPGEVLALYNDPFGLLRPRIVRQYVRGSAAAAAAGYLLVAN